MFRGACAKNKLGGLFYTIEKSPRELQERRQQGKRSISESFGSAESSIRKITQSSQAGMLNGLNA